MRTRQIMEQNAVVGAGTSRGSPGGHHYFCPKCKGFRATENTLREDRTIVERCRSCGTETTLAFYGGVWMEKSRADTMKAYVTWKIDRVVTGYLAKQESPTPIEEPGIVERSKGAVVRRFPALANLTHREVEDALGDVHDEGDEQGGDSDDSRDAEPREMPPGPARPHVKQPGPLADSDVATSPEPAPHHRFSSRWKVAAWAACAPFVAMGILYAMAWKGIYVWPIYYAIQPYYRPWMNEWWFWGWSVIVPVVVAAVYAWRTRRVDVIDWEPEPAESRHTLGMNQASTKAKRPHGKPGDPIGFDRPDWLDEG